MKKLILPLAFCCSIIFLSAQNGILDTSFGNQGHVLEPVKVDYCSGMSTLVLPSGKIMLGGYLHQNLPQMNIQGLLNGYLPDGSVDSSFANNGQLDSNLISSNWVIMKLILQPDGKMIAIGFYDFSDIGILMRFDQNGDLDSSFGTNGYNIIDYTNQPSEATHVNDVALLPNGDIIVCGELYDYSTYQSFVARYTNSGSLDSSFGIAGVQVLPLSSNYNFGARSLQVQADGKILLSGTAESWVADRMMLVRLLPDGSFDQTFGTNGIVRHAPFYSEWIQKIVLLGNGKILCIGQTEITGEDIFLSRLRPNGDIDSSYGKNGFVECNLQSGFGYWVNDVMLLPDKSVVFSVRKRIASHNEFVLGRVLAHGQLDASFGTNGFIYSSFPNESNYNSLALIDEQSFLASGNVRDSVNSSLLLSKYLLKSYVSVKEHDLHEAMFQVYPNPNSGFVTISVKRPEHLTLYNFQGQAVWSGQVNRKPSTLNLDYLPSGVYFMVDQMGNSQKLVLSK